MIGKTISHYKILSKLGFGGMGEVYLAKDTKLDRKVALKFLPAQLTLDHAAKERFEREARAAAALNHPNIVTIYEIAEHDEQTFIAMEYVDGQSLREKMGGKPMPGGEILDIVTQICEGLDKAHKAGIVHRDIKPENILIDSDGRVKILDFGLAKLKGASKLTKEASTIGTVYYMSPEQVKGEVVDHRSDIWSVGVVLYEMVTGEAPFKGDYEQAVIYSILNEEVKSLTDFDSGVSLELERVVRKCLAKNPQERYQHISDLLTDFRPSDRNLTSSSKYKARKGNSVRGRHRFDLRMVSLAAVVLVAFILLFSAYFRIFKSPSGNTSSDVKKLAVLFFENLGPSEDEYFADGITDAITARLAVIHGLGVISRQSTIQYKDSKKSTRDIGRELGVDYILEGTIQRERPGDPTSRVRIIPQLINVSDDIHLWADTYDEDMTEVFRVQSGIAERVAHALDVTLLETEREAIGVAPTENFGAYEYYLRGNEYFFGSDRYYLENAMMAVQMYERATGLDPEFIEAWAGLSKAYIWAFYSQYDATSERKTAAKEALDRASKINPNSPDVQIAEGYYHYYGAHDFDRALVSLESARSSRPNDVELLSIIAFIKRRQGKWEEAATLLEKAAELNPRYFVSVVELGITYVSMRQYDKAERLLDRSIFLAPENANGHVFKILVPLLRDGYVEKAEEALGAASEVVKPAALGFDLQGFMLMRVMPEKYAELLNRVPPEDYGIEDTTLFHLGLAEIYHQLGQEEQARGCWEKALIHLASAQNPVYQYDIALCLGLAYAGLGRNEEAIRLAREAIAKAPLSADAVRGAFRLEMAALIFVRTGEYEEAIDQLELLLSVPSETSRASFRLDPAWDPLRDNPRFQTLVGEES